MNKIYKVIWNRVRHCYVVVSEIAKNHGKEHSTNLRVSKGLCALTLAIGLSLSSYAFAAGNTDTSVPFGVKDNGKSVASADYDANGNLTIGNQVQAAGDKPAGKNNTAIGTNTDTLRNVTEGETTKNGQPLDTDDHKKLVDSEGQAHNLDEYRSTEAGGSTAVGYNNHNEGDRSTTIGNTAKIINKPVTYYADKDGNKTTSKDDAAWYKDSSGNPTQVPQVFRDANGNTTTTPQYVHTYTEKDSTTGEEVTKTEITSDPSKADQKDGKPVYNYRKSDNLDKLYSVTLYQAASNSIAAGTNVTANGNNAVAVGYNSTADNSAVAVGDTANASGESSIAAGTKATASGTNATAVGSTSTASGDNTIAIGTGAKATDSSDNKYGSIAIGKGVEANGSSTAVGLNGTEATYGSSAYGNNAIAQNSSAAFGSNIQASNSSYASGMGTADKPVSATESSYATGMGGTTATKGSMAVGNNVHATSSAFASGRNGTSATNGGIAYGDNVSAQYGGFAAGTNSTSASSGVAVGSNVHASDGSSYAGGMNGTTAGNGSIAFGNNVHAGSSGGGAFAAGMNGTTADDSSVAVGDNVHATGGSFAAGMGETSASSSAVAIGNNAHAYGNSYAFGSSAHADSTSVAIGNSSYATNSSLALGNSAGAYVSGGIALGSNSTAYRASGTTGLDPRTGKAYTDTSDKTWNSTYGALSIGNVDSDGTVNGTRQIIGVAAGTNDTDAVNVAQLKAAMTQSGSIHDYSVNSTDTANDTNYTNAGATGSNALAAGVSAQAKGAGAVAVGNGAQASKNYSVAIGNGAQANEIGAIALGNGAVATGIGAMVIGQYNTAEGQNSLAFGGGYNDANKGNKASSTAAVAFGEGSWAVSEGSVAFGYGTQAGNTITKNGKYTGQNAVAFGNGTKALGGRSLAFGENTTANYNDSVAFGNGATAFSSGATAFGNRSRALSQYATSFGDNSVAAGSMSFAFGTDTIAGAALDDNGALELTDGSRMDSYGNKAYTTTDAGGNKTTYSIKGMKPFSGNDPHDYVVVTGTKADGTTGTYVEDYQGGIVEVKVNEDGTVTKVKDLYSGKYGGWYQYDEQGNIIQTGTDKNKKPAVVSSDTLKAQKKPIPVTLDKATPGSNGYTLNGFKNATSFGYSTEASGDNATAFGNDTKAKAAAATAFGTTTIASGDNATAFGLSTTASGKQATAFGSSSTASGDNAIAFGESSVANGEASVAFGIKSEADGKNSLAGLGGKAYADNTIALGQNASAHVDGAIAIGNTAYDQATNGVALGTRASIVPHGSETISDATAIGTDTKVMGSRSTAIGYKASAMKDDAVVLGNNIISQAEHSTIIGFDGGISSGTYNTVVGADSGVSGNYNTSIGYKNNIVQSSTNSLVLGSNSKINGGSQLVAIGYNATAQNGSDSLALGFNNAAQGSNNISIGTNSMTMNDITTAIGYHASAYGGNGATAIGQYTTANGENSAVLGSGKSADQQTSAIGKNSLALGAAAKVVADSSLAIGDEAATTGKQSIAIGTSSNVWGEAGVALGRNTGAAEDSTAIGDGANAWKSHAMALGKGANGAVEYGIALGEGATVTNPYKQDENNNWVEDTEHAATGAVAIGRSALTNVEGGVALGQNSQSVTAKGVAGYDVLTKTASTDSSSTWVSTSGAVSVGDKAKNLTRQITNLAAGYEDTDAVNVAQLKAVAGSHTTVSVGNTKVMADNTPVKGGNLELKRTTTNGQYNYDVSLNKDITLGTQDEKNGGSLTINTLGTFHEKDEQGNQKDVPIKEAVKIDGSTISIVKHDGTDGENDQRQVVLGVGPDAGGYVVLYDKTGKKPTYIYNSITPGATYLQDGNSYTADKANEYGRLEYGDYYNGSTQFIATLNDGQKYAGDNYQAAKTETKTVDGKTTTTIKTDEQNVLLKKLNERLDIQGGADKDKLTEKNIGVKVEDGVMKVQLAQNLDLGDNGSVKMGNTTINNGGVTITTKNGDTTNTISLTENGLNNGGKTITNVGNGADDNDAVNVSQLNAAKTTVTSNDHSVTVTSDNNATDKHTNYDLKIATATLSSETTGSGDSAVATGKVAVTNPTYTENGQTVENKNAYVTGQSVADAINKSGFKLTASASEGAVAGNKETLIHPGDTVTIDAGKNISLTQTDGKISIATKDKLVLGKDTSDGKDGQEGTIGLTGKDGVPGTDGKQGYSTTIIKTEKGQKGADGKTGKENLGGTDITRIVYTDKDGNNPQTVATLSDGLKFAGDDMSKTVDKKLNETLQIRGDGTYDKTTQTAKADGNIQVSADKNTGTIKVALNKDINLKQDGSLTVGGDTQDGSTTGQDPIIIKHFDAGKLTVTGTDENGKTPQSKPGDYVTGLDNKDWDVTNPTYVSGRAATEDQLKTISDAVNKAASTAGMHTVVTVNDKDSSETTATVGTDGKYGDYSDPSKGNLLIASKDENGKTTYNIKLNDQLAIGKNGTPGQDGKDGKDGKVTVETSKGTTVVIGHDGEPGKDGKDGLFVTGKDGKDGKSGVSITGPDGVAGKAGVDGKVGIAGEDGKDAVSITGKDGVGHIGLTGQKGADGKDGVFNDLSTILGTATLDPAKNEQSKSKDTVSADDKSSRIQYQTTITDKDGKTKTVITHEVATMDDGMKYAGNFGDGASVKLNKTVTIKGKVKDGAKEDDFVDGNIAVVANKNGEDGELLIKLNKDLTGLNSATYKTSIKNGDVTTTSTTVVDGTGLKIDNGPSITNTGINGGSKKITNVATGTDGTDAVNVSQLNAVKTLAGQHTTVEAGPSGNVTVTPGTNADGSKKYTVDLTKNVTFGKAGDGDKTVAISGTDGTVTAGTGDNKVTVDGLKGQIVAGGDQGVKIGKIAEGDSSLTIYDKDGNATKGTDKAGQYVTNLDNKTWNKDGSYVSGRAATEDQLHQLESSFNTKVDAVEKHHTEVTVNGGTAAKADGSYTDGNLQLKQTTDKDGHKIYDLKLNDDLNIGSVGKAGKDGKNGHIGINGKDGKSGVGIDGKDGISVIGADGKNGVSITGSNGKDGKNGIDGKITIGTPGKDGQPGKDAISISGQNGEGHIGLTGPAGKDGKDASADIHVKNGQVGVDGTDGHGGKNGMDRVVYEDHNGTPHEVATMDDGMKYGDDFGNTAKVKLNHQLDIVGDINAGKKDGDKKATKDDLSDGNIGIIATDTTYNEDGTVKENGKMTVKLAKDLKGLNSIESNSVTTGNTTINNSGLTIKTGDEKRNITVQDGNVNMGGNQIHNVAPGQAPGDAVNVSQLNATNYAVNKLGTRVNRVGAGAAALAALHPLDFDPDDKWDFAAGYGNYKDASAVAVGAYYRPNEDTMFSVGGSFGGGENMVNAGVSFKVGQGNHVSTSRVAMAKEIKDLRQDVANLNAIVNRQSALIDKLTGTNAGTIQDAGNDLFPDVPANHWAYEYVTKLKQAGILTGYPDGNFDGDRMMTRYEFAAIVYRAIMAGAASNPALSQDGTLDKLAKEFSPEMKHIRIDTIAKDKNGKPTIERVRVIPEAKQ